MGAPLARTEEILQTTRPLSSADRDLLYSFPPPLDCPDGYGVELPLMPDLTVIAPGIGEGLSRLRGLLLECPVTVYLIPKYEQNFKAGS